MPRIPQLRKKQVGRYAYGVVYCQGREVTLGQFGTPECQRRYNQWVRTFMESGYVAPVTDPGDDTLLVSELAAAFFAHAKTYYHRGGEPTSTLELYRTSLNVLCDRFGMHSAESFGPKKLKALQQAMVDLGWSRGVVNASIHRVRKAFRWAVSEELLPASVYQALQSVDSLRKGRTEAPDRPPVKPVPDDVIDATIAKLPQVVADMVRFQRLTGCRPQQVRLIRPCEVDTSRDVWLYTPDTHKTEHRGKTLVIAVGPRAQDVLRPYLLRPDDSYCFSPGESERKRRDAMHASRTVPDSCGNVPGTVARAFRSQYTKAAYATAVRRAAKRANVSHWSPNQLRHAAATQFRALGGIEVASAALGHSSVNTTEIYAEKDLQAAMDLARQVG